MMTPPVLPMVTSTLGTPTLLELAGLKLPPGLPVLLSAALGVKALGLLDLNVLHDYAHGNQIGKTGIYWKGRKPTSGDLTDVLPQLVQDDQIGPSMEAEVNALFGKEPDWDALLGGNSLDTKAEIPAALTAWQQESRLNDILRDAARARWWAGRLVMRVSVPDDYAEQIKTTPPKTLDEALELIYVESLDPRHAGPLIDAHGRTIGYWNRYVQKDADGQDATYVELYTRDTVHRFLQGTAGALTPLPDFEADNPMASVGTTRRPTFLMFHADRDGGSSITLSARDAQDRLNVVTTYKGRNDEQTGYRQFIVSNAEPPTDPSGKPAAYQMGPGVVVNLKGLTVVPEDISETNMPSRLTPKWEVVDPLNPADYHIPSMDDWIKRILDKFDQTWRIDGEARSGVSGESKRQSRKPFERRVAFASQDIGSALAWALKAALMLAGMMIGPAKQAEYQDVTFTPKLTLDVDAANLEELKVKLLMWQAGGLSLDAMLESTPGVTDVAMEKGRIEEDRATNPLTVNREEALKKLLDAGAQTIDQNPVSA